jgi:hypothetical protein
MIENIEAVRSKLTEIVSAGLVKGLGTPEPGKLCLEAAVCLALGEAHGDKPSCVAAPDNAFAIRLQDAYPGTPEERARLFLPLGLAQLGTADTDRKPWLRLLIEGTIRKVLPMWLRNAAEKQRDETHRAALFAVAERCESDGTQESARHARQVADAAADAASAYAAAASASIASAAAADADADAAAAAASAYAAAASAAAYAAADAGVLRKTIEMSVSVALEAYAAEGRS